MLRLTEIIGYATDPTIADQLHDISHRGTVEYLNISQQGIGRRRLRITSDCGTDCAISVSRDVALTDGAVLLLKPSRGIVVRLGEQQWLRLRPFDSSAALELGYNAGNLHWKVRFDGVDLLVAQNGPVEPYLARLKALFDSGRISEGED